MAIEVNANGRVEILSQNPLGQYVGTAGFTLTDALTIQTSNNINVIGYQDVHPTPFGVWSTTFPLNIFKVGMLHETTSSHHYNQYS